MEMETNGMLFDYTIAYMTENSSITIYLAVFHSCIEEEFSVDMIRIITGQNDVHFGIPCIWSKS